MRNPVFVFFGSFLLLYGVLIAPWPGWNDAYGAYFRLLGTAAFSRDEGPRLVQFEYHPLTHGFTEANTRMILGNRLLADSSGHGPGFVVDLDTRSIGWIPTALTSALIMATPIPWPRRVRALFWGLVGIYLFILFSLQIQIWDQESKLSLSTPAPLMKALLDSLNYTLFTQVGASFSVPLLLWILVTFREGDLGLLEKFPSRRP